MWIALSLFLWAFFVVWLGPLAVPHADSDSPPEDQPTSQTLTEKGNSDTDVSAETADDDKSNGKTDSTPSMENNPIENNSETLKENTPENGNEASAVEKWLRSITSSRPKSDD